MYDKVIQGKIPIGTGLAEVNICISDGKIEKIRRTLAGTSQAGEMKDFRGSLILPGAVDLHVHYRDPGQTVKEDFLSGSTSSAFGGVTTVCDMPNNVPAVVGTTTYVKKYGIAARRSLVDFGLYLMMTPKTDRGELVGLLQGEAGAPPPVAIKVFMGRSTASQVFHPIEDLSVWAGVIKNAGKVVAVHAEDGSVFKDTIPGGGSGVLAVHQNNRPSEAEVMAVSRIRSALGGDTGLVHLLHISSREGLKEAEASGASIEVTPHHLFLDRRWAERNLEPEARGKVNPPLRNPGDRRALWDGIRVGTVTTIGSDHAPHLQEEKELGMDSPSGVPGTETMIPLMLQAVKDRMLSLPSLLRISCSGPAARYSLEGKGAIEEGCWADLAVYDMSGGRKIRGEELHSRCGWTPYEGMTGIFPHHVYLRGELLVDSGSICQKPGNGRCVTHGISDG